MRYSESQAIAALVMLGLPSEEVIANAAPVYLGIWPVNNTGGPKAEGVMIRPTAGIRLAVSKKSEVIAVPNTMGANSAYLAANVEYVFPLHPHVTTLGFVDDQSTTTRVYVRWIIIR